MKQNEIDRLAAAIDAYNARLVVFTVKPDEYPLVFKRVCEYMGYTPVAWMTFVEGTDPGVGPRIFARYEQMAEDGELDWEDLEADWWDAAN